MQIDKVTTIEEFLGLNYREAEKSFQEKTDSWWQKSGERFAVSIFKQACERVPAYKEFLKKRDVLYLDITKYSDFQKLPITSKKNYIDRFPLESLVWDGDLSRNEIIHSSSGTTGVPYFWPISMNEIIQGAGIKEILYKSIFQVHKKRTLLIICFGMGTWIAGSYTLLTSQLVSQKGPPMTIVTPGFNKEEALNLLSRLGPKYDQVILAGIPTFLKDLLDEWKSIKEAKKVKKILFLFAAEGISETLREYLLEMVSSTDPLRGAISIYGSADGALMGFETPFSIFVRKYAFSNKSFCQELFGDERLPSLYQYIPTFRFFEVENNELLLTAYRGIPLIRYNMHDQGGILQASKISALLKKYKVSLTEKPNNLPFIFVFGRGKFAATLYAANIYPEHVREVFVDKSLRGFITGRFVLGTKFTSKQDHYLEVNAELSKGFKKNKKYVSQLTRIFVEKMRVLSSEYNRVFQEYGQKAVPVIVLHEYGQSALFPIDRLKKTS